MWQDKGLKVLEEINSFIGMHGINENTKYSQTAMMSDDVLLEADILSNINV